MSSWFRGEATVAILYPESFASQNDGGAPSVNEKFPLGVEGPDQVESSGTVQGLERCVESRHIRVRDGIGWMSVRMDLSDAGWWKTRMIGSGFLHSIVLERIAYGPDLASIFPRVGKRDGKAFGPRQAEKSSSMGEVAIRHPH